MQTIWKIILSILTGIVDAAIPNEIANWLVDKFKGKTDGNGRPIDPIRIGVNIILLVVALGVVTGVIELETFLTLFGLLNGGNG